MLTKEDYRRVLEISHELSGILKRSRLDAIELHIKDGMTDIPNEEKFILYGKNYQRVTGWAKDNNGQEEDYEEFLNKGKHVFS